MIADWKGEHFLTVNNRLGAPRKPPEQRKKPPATYRNPKRRGPKCVVPDCESNTSERSTSLVCRNHNHLKPYCECRKCKP